MNMAVPHNIGKTAQPSAASAPSSRYVYILIGEWNDLS
jgi:hypothetical protein